MSLAKYNALLKVMEHNSITRAAEEIGYTQSGISYMIKTLETEIGFQLLIRSKEGVIPTENAMKLKPILKKLINTHKELETAINDINNAGLECIRIGSYNSMLLKWIPQILKKFFIQYPDADVNLVEGSDAELADMLNAGEIDIAFTANSTANGFSFTKLADDPFVVVLPEDHPLATWNTISIDDLCAYNLILPNENYYSWLTDYIKSNNLRNPVFKYSMKDSSSIVSLVEGNLAISVLPMRSMTIIPESVVLRELDVPHSRDLGISYQSKKHLLPILSEFIKTAKEVITEKEL